MQQHYIHFHMFMAILKTARCCTVGASRCGYDVEVMCIALADNAADAVVLIECSDAVVVCRTG